MEIRMNKRGSIPWYYGLQLMFIAIIIMEGVIIYLLATGYFRTTDMVPLIEGQEDIANQLSDISADLNDVKVEVINLNVGVADKSDVEKLTNQINTLNHKTEQIDNRITSLEVSVSQINPEVVQHIQWNNWNTWINNYNIRIIFSVLIALSLFKLVPKFIIDIKNRQQEIPNERRSAEYDPNNYPPKY
jgi:hypothetical protein